MSKFGIEIEFPIRRTVLSLHYFSMTAGFQDLLKASNIVEKYFHGKLEGWKTQFIVVIQN